MPDRPVLLSVDDEANVLKSIRRTLRTLDVEIVTAASGREALDVIAGRSVDIILTDMRMPEMGGQEFLKQAAALQPTTKRIVLSAHADAEDMRTAINEGGVSHYLSKPWEDDELRHVIEEALRVRTLEREHGELTALVQRQNEDLQALNTELEARVDRRTGELARTNDVLTQTLEHLNETYAQMVEMVANIAALPNPESANARRKLNLALAIGEAMELDEEALQDLANATRLHRVGWTGIPRRITEKPLTRMSAAERAIFEQHPTYALAGLLSVPRLRRASAIILSQHEEYAGTGFPNRLTGEGIVLGARILAVARDYYDAISGRITTGKMKPAIALEYINDGSKTRYDPEVVAEFVRVLPSLEAIEANLNEIRMNSSTLQPGMRLARELTTSGGFVLLAKNTVLTEPVLETLLNLERRSEQALQIYVLNESGDK